MQILYPEIKPYSKFELVVDDIHTLYVEECGDPHGIPVLFLHGGPGGGCGPNDRRFFDPEKYRIILFDQRGAGRSKPHANLENNTSQHLISDIESIRNKLNIDQWLLFGGSWGSTLSLLYAQAHPTRVMAMILRGIFLCRERDLHWFYESGADRIFPDYWKDFIAPLKESELHDGASYKSNMARYYEKLTGNNELAKMGAAKAWSQWEGRCATLKPHPEVVSHFTDPHLALSLARIEAHYFMQHAFIEENQIINNCNTITDIPGIIVHGRYDMVCPLDNAQVLYDNWRKSELHIIRDAGHSSSEPGIVDALVKATNDMAQRLAGEGGHTS